MSTTYLSVDYFPLTVNFFDRDAIELAEAKYGIRVDGAVCKLLCKIFKEGYYIPWGEEQSLIFARKLGGELSGKEMDGIIQILLDKGFFDKESYEKFQILTSLEIQHFCQNPAHLDRCHLPQKKKIRGFALLADQ